jgi:protein required for attachment to host cells
MTFKHEKRFLPVIWIVVADRSRARVISANWPEPAEWEEVLDLVHAEGALKASEVNSDRQGTFGEAAGRHHVGEPRTDFKHQTAERFADEIVEHLEKGRLENKFGKIGLVCPPLFLGVLRKRMPAPPSYAGVSYTID